MEKLGSIIAVCGVDGVGKSTLCGGLRRYFSGQSDTVELFSRTKKEADRLSLAGKYVLPYVQEPHPWLSGDFATIVSDGLLLDFLESYHERLAPAYRRGKTVVCDRYTPCFFAYIRAVQGCTLFEEVLQRLRPPDMVLYLAAPAAALAVRQTQRGGRQADEDPVLQGRFDAAYRTYFQERSLKWVELDAARPPAEVLSSACRVIEEFISLPRISANA